MLLCPGHLLVVIALRITREVGGGWFEGKEGGGEAGEGEGFPLELGVRGKSPEGQAPRSGDGGRYGTRGTLHQGELLELKIGHGRWRQGYKV